MSIVYLARHHPIQMSEQNRIIAILDFFHVREILANRVLDGIIHYGERTHVVLESTLRERIMRAMCDSPLIGHSGYLHEYEAPHMT
jgi:hypothetical protein